MPLVLMVVADAELAAGTERIAAAVGARTVRALTPGRRSWLRAAAIVVDEPCALRLAEADLPRRDGVVLVGSDEPTPASWSAAIAVGAQHVCVLPVQETDLVRHVAAGLFSRWCRGAAVAERRCSPLRWEHPPMRLCWSIWTPAAAASICCWAQSPRRDRGGPNCACTVVD
jgi:hypothetical protein